MATGAEAIEAVAWITGILPSTIARTARALREAGQDLWPHAARGGGKNAAHVRNKHLVCLALAFGADPITSAPDLVLGMRALVPFIEGSSQSFLSGDTLGEVLDSYLEMISTRRGREDFGQSFPYFAVVLHRRGVQSPSVSLHASGMMDRQMADLECYYQPLQQEIDFAPPDLPIGAPITKLTLNFSLFETLADLWADTKAREAKISAASTSQLPLPSGSLETENAALPGAALPNIQDHGSATPAAHTPEFKGKRENSQPSLNHGPGPSPKSHRKDRHHGRTADPTP